MGCLCTAETLVPGTLKMAMPALALPLASHLSGHRYALARFARNKVFVEEIICKDTTSQVTGVCWAGLVNTATSCEP
jgi:hypothetical protein